MFLLNLFETVNHKHAYLDIVVGYIFLLQPTQNFWHVICCE